MRHHSERSTCLHVSIQRDSERKGKASEGKDPDWIDSQVELEDLRQFRDSAMAETTQQHKMQLQSGFMVCVVVLLLAILFKLSYE